MCAQQWKSLPKEALRYVDVRRGVEINVLRHAEGKLVLAFHNALT